jgi:hypothetical protein
MPIATRLNSLNVMFSSKVVLMGVSLASLKLGGIRLFSSREEFDQAVQQAVSARAGT